MQSLDATRRPNETLTVSFRTAADRAYLPRDFYAFARSAFPLLGPFVDSWHIAELCAHLQACAERRIKRLAIALPPGLSKSTVVCVLFPAWWWITEPWHRWMFVSVDPALVSRDAKATRGLIESDWYRARWGDKFRIVSNSRDRAEGAQEYYTRSPGNPDGLRFSTSLRSKGVGWHVHTQIGDDLIKPGDGLGASLEARNKWANTYSSRIAEPTKHFVRIVCQQRLGPADMIGQAIEKGYEQLIFPMTSDPARYDLPPDDPRALQRSSLWDPETCTGGDRRTEPGELLCPERKDAEDVATAKLDGEHAYGPQQEQDPTQSKDRPYSRERLTARWRVLPPGGTHTWDWDFASKGEAQRASRGGSWTVGWHWYETASASYLLEEIRGNGDFVWKRNAIEGAGEGVHYLEDKASGPDIQAAIADKVPDVRMVSAVKSKTDRAIAVEAYLDRVYFPVAPWVEDVMNELDRFPSPPNDRGDVLSQHLARRWLPQTDAKKRAEAAYSRGLAGLGQSGENVRTV